MKTTSAQNSQILYRHTKRPGWGLAVVAWDQVDKRGYQFEDGKLRVFTHDFYRMLEEVDPPADQTRRVLEQLGRAMGRREAVRSKGGVLVPVAEQIAYFKEQYPDGFSGDAWTRKMRGDGAKTVLKRHRDPTLTRARERLAPKKLKRLINARQYDAVVDSLVDVLEQTNLVTSGKLGPLRSATQRRREAIALALPQLLYGEGPFASRFDELVRGIGEPSWELATAPMALVYPEAHACIKPGVFNQQALWMAPHFAHSRRPTGETYQRYLKMALAVSRLLEEAGVPPRDLLDVHDFIDLTLRPATRKLLAERGREHSAAEPARDREAA